MERKFNDTRWSSFVSIYIVEQNKCNKALSAAKNCRYANAMR